MRCGYHAAYALIYDNADYVGGIAALRALGYDDHPDVATLIGYASRKLGRYDDAKIWYERALAADPNHAVTWSYYGMWHAEQGNVLKAKDDLEKVHLICGNTDCRPYQMLKEVIEGTATYLKSARYVVLGCAPSIGEKRGEVSATSHAKQNRCEGDGGKLFRCRGLLVGRPRWLHIL